MRVDRLRQRLGKRQGAVGTRRAVVLVLVGAAAIPLATRSPPRRVVGINRSAGSPARRPAARARSRSRRRASHTRQPSPRGCRLRPASLPDEGPQRGVRHAQAARHGREARAAGGRPPQRGRGPAGSDPASVMRTRPAAAAPLPTRASTASTSPRGAPATRPTRTATSARPTTSRS